MMNFKRRMTMMKVSSVAEKNKKKKGDEMTTLEQGYHIFKMNPEERTAL